MRINSNKYLPFNIWKMFSLENMVNEYVHENSSKISDDLTENSLIHQAYGMYSKMGKIYFLTRSALDVIEPINFNNNKELKAIITDSFPCTISTIIVSETSYFKVIKVDEGWLEFMYFSLDKNERLEHYAGVISPDSEVDENSVSYKPYILLCKILVFICCTNTELVILAGKGMNKPRKATINSEKTINELDVEVTVVNSKFNKIIKRDEEFYVNTHGRFQPYGAKRELVKYIIIEGYYKKGYQRSYK